MFANPTTYLYIFLQSNLLEVPVYYAFYRRNLSFKKTLWLVTLCNMITHPIVFFGFMAAHHSYLWSTLGAETFAILTEALLNALVFSRMEYPIPFSRALKSTLSASIWANLLSWQLGPLLTYLLVF